MFQDRDFTRVGGWGVTKPLILWRSFFFFLLHTLPHICRHLGPHVNIWIDSSTPRMNIQWLFIFFSYDCFSEIVDTLDYLLLKGVPLSEVLQVQHLRVPRFLTEGRRGLPFQQANKGQSFRKWSYFFKCLAVRMCQTSLISLRKRVSCHMA